MNQKGMGDLLKQVSKMKKDMERVNDDLKNRYIEEQSGGGLVSVTVNGQQELVKISIDPSVLQAGDDGQVDLEMFEGRADRRFWKEVQEVLPVWDQMIDDFNARTGV